MPHKTVQILIPRMRLLFLCFSLILCAPFGSSLARPLAPEDLRYEIYSETAAELFWSRTTNEPVQGYEIARNGEIVGVFDALSFFDDELIARNDYTYTITAIGLDGDRSDASSVSFRPPESADEIASLQRYVADLEQEIVELEALLDAGIRSPVPQTGQSVSLQAGDDGDNQTGLAWPDPRFTLNVEPVNDLNENGRCESDSELCNGTVTDNLTGLIWLQNANCFGERVWSDAINDANTLAGGDVSNCGLGDNSQSGDWRLPNIKEVQSLMDYGHSFPTALLPSDHPFIDVQIGGVLAPPDRYWSSTSIGPASMGVYAVSLSVGWVERFSLSQTNFQFYVLPVRGGAF